MDKPLPDFPEWASWSWSSDFLPAEFHTKEGFQKLLMALNSITTEQPIYALMEYTALVIGIAWNELAVTDDVVPQWVSDSPLGAKHQKMLLKSFPKFEFSAPPVLDGPTTERYVYYPCLSLCSHSCNQRTRKEPTTICCVSATRQSYKAEKGTRSRGSRQTWVCCLFSSIVVFPSH